MKIYNSYDEIKADVDKGVKVHWANELYYVSKQKWDNSYLIWCESNGSCGGLIENEKDLSKFYSD